ncbi:MAG TPA: VanZ family protein [Segeticoccus sp.]|uniref:VanZ family protein n=1 Tax=Segeticoccus sp. TaxID=2706531 RepID=UPI002D7EE317|nr:VanZ family protein [Segeticoccus sp.]HET8600659.1 VanZ family protein [Segeticoccus sp.]
MARPGGSRSGTQVEARSNRLWPGLLGVLVAIQLLVLYIPTAPGGVEVSGLDKVVHAGVFGLPALLAAARRWWWVVVALVVHAPVSEVLQATLLPHRDGSVWDAVADLVGVALGLLVSSVWRRLAR